VLEGTCSDANGEPFVLRNEHGEALGRASLWQQGSRATFKGATFERLTVLAEAESLREAEPESTDGGSNVISVVRF
jgi:hypothetical protein